MGPEWSVPEWFDESVVWMRYDDLKTDAGNVKTVRTGKPSGVLARE